MAWAGINLVAVTEKNYKAIMEHNFRTQHAANAEDGQDGLNRIVLGSKEAVEAAAAIALGESGAKPEGSKAKRRRGLPALCQSMALTIDHEWFFGSLETGQEEAMAWKVEAWR